MLNEILVIALLVVAFVMGVLSGVLWYRYQLRTRPEKLQEWIDQANEAASNLQGRAKEALDTQINVIQSQKDELVKELTSLLARLK